MPKSRHRKIKRARKHMPTPLEGARYDLDRAKRYIADYKRRETSFFKTKFHAAVIETDAEGVNELHKIVLRRHPSRAMTDAAFDAMEKLRGVLDKTIYAIGVATHAAGLGTPKLDHLQFPVGDTAADYENAIKGRCKGLPPEILTALRGFKVYEGAQDIVWALNRARRQGYHRIIKPVGLNSGVTPGRASLTGKRPSYIPSPVWNKEKDEIIYRVVGPEGAFGYDAKLVFNIFFGDVEGVHDIVVRVVLDSAFMWVERFMRDLVAESRRIGLKL